MTFEPANAKQSFIPTTVILPDITEGEEHNLILTDYIKKVIASLNEKEIAQYVEREIVTGQKYFTPNNNNKFRGTFRKVINFGQLPNASSKSIPHGISIDSNTIFTRIFATSSAPGSSFIPIPFASPVLADGISIEVDAFNIVITTGSDRSEYTTTYVVLEYIKDGSSFT